MLTRKKSLRDYSRDKRLREGKPLYAARKPQEWPRRKPAVSGPAGTQGKKQVLPCAATLPKKALRRQSKRMAREMDAYHGQRAVFLQRFPVCGACLVRDLTPTASAQIHHSRGRIGRLLRDERFWIGVCAECHSWIHENAREARALGLLAPATEFNTSPR